MYIILLMLAVLFATFEQTLTGFGFSLIVMPLVTLLFDLRTASPLVALMGLTLYIINLLRYRQAVNFREVWRLGIASALGIPVGLWVLANVNEALIKSLLGLILMAYAVYSLVHPPVPRLRSGHWGYLAGFIAGCLSGAYNTPGPPLVVYGSLRQWAKDEFRAILQAIFLLNAALTVTSHYLTGHLTTPVLTSYAYALPALLLGILIAALVDSKINKERFRTIVTVMILVLGVSLIRV